jgi:hypothetical protein
MMNHGRLAKTGSGQAQTQGKLNEQPCVVLRAQCPAGCASGGNAGLLSGKETILLFAPFL